MPSHTQETIWPCHWERVYKLFVDFPLRHPDHYLQAHPDISDVIVLADEEQGHVRYYMVEFHSATEIPPMLRPIIKPEMLNWVQESWWDTETRTCRQRNIPNFMAEHVDIRNEWVLTPVSDTQTRETWTFSVESSLPVFGGFLAGQILSRGVASRQRNMDRYLSQLQEGFGA